MKFLVLNYMINMFSGSEINAIQLCEGLRNLGHEADIGTFVLGSPLQEVVKQHEINVIELLKIESERLDYDVIWAHHSPVLAYLLFKKNISNCRVIYSSLSPIEPLEAPPMFYKDISFFLSMSSVNTSVMEKNGVPAEQIHYFPNYAPDSFFIQPGNEYPNTPQKIAIISNHPPQEIIDFSTIAREQGIQVDIIGLEHTPVFVDDVFLKQYDLVITIGKTVIYCFALRIPIYCYDRFGGSGFITPQNFDKNMDCNFSGRGIDRKLDGPSIYQDIIYNYADALSFLNYLYIKSGEHFHFENNLSKVLEFIPDIPIINIERFRSQHSLDERLYDIFLSRQWDIEIYQEQNCLNLNLARELERARSEILFYSESKSWKITRPLRKIRKLITEVWK